MRRDSNCSTPKVNPNCPMVETRRTRDKFYQQNFYRYFFNNLFLRFYRLPIIEMQCSKNSKFISAVNCHHHEAIRRSRGSPNPHDSISLSKRFLVFTNPYNVRQRITEFNTACSISLEMYINAYLTIASKGLSALKR